MGFSIAWGCDSPKPLAASPQSLIAAAQNQSFARITVPQGDGSVIHRRIQTQIPVGSGRKESACFGVVLFRWTVPRKKHRFPLVWHSVSCVRCPYLWGQLKRKTANISAPVGFPVNNVLHPSRTSLHCTSSRLKGHTLLSDLFLCVCSSIIHCSLFPNNATVCSASHLMIGVDHSRVLFCLNMV